MEHLEREALWSAPTPPRHWFRYVDDTFVIQQQANKQVFLDDINSIDPAIQFTVKGNQDNGTIPFLDTLVTPQTDHSLSITVYYKPTHNDQYVQWDSNHNLSAKYSVIRTLTHRTNTVCTTPELLNQELEHLREALVRCKYPRWAINTIQNKYANNNWEANGNNNTNQGEDSILGPNRGTSTEVSNNNNKASAGQIVVPYVQGLGKNLKKICSRYGVQITLQGKNHHQTNAGQTKGQGPQGLPKQCHLQLPM